MEPITYPVRINRYLALKGYCTRREADELIKRGRVFINGELAELGSKVEEKDNVTLEKRGSVKTPVYLAFNKPVDIVTGSEPGQKGIRQIAKLPKDVFPVGRLDKESHGLLLLTNDGRLTDRLLNPDHDHDKEYEVTVDKPITNLLLKHLKSGVEIEGYKTKPAVVKELDERRFSIVLTEGKKHQIRRMCAALGFQVTNLRRVRIMNISLGQLKPGTSRVIEGAELNKLLTSLGLAADSK
jgi:23S rRNA pseudouridine2604 synthase